MSTGTTGDDEIGTESNHVRPEAGSPTNDPSNPTKGVSWNNNNVNYIGLDVGPSDLIVEGLLLGLGGLRGAGRIKPGVISTGVKPPNLSPSGASRSGAFNEAKRQSGVPVSQQPSRVSPNIDKRGNIKPGKTYEFDIPTAGGGTKTVKIRDDANGHNYGPGNSQNRGPHFNDKIGNHFDY